MPNLLGQITILHPHCLLAAHCLPTKLVNTFCFDKLCSFTALIESGYPTFHFRVFGTWPQTASQTDTVYFVRHFANFGKNNKNALFHNSMRKTLNLSQKKWVPCQRVMIFTYVSFSMVRLWFVVNGIQKTYRGSFKGFLRHDGQCIVQTR